MSSQWSLVSFVGSHISKVCWLSAGDPSLGIGYFATGTSVTENEIHLWSIEQSLDDEGFDMSEMRSPTRHAKETLPSGVSVLKNLPGRAVTGPTMDARLLIGMEDGSVCLLNVLVDPDPFNVSAVWYNGLGKGKSGVRRRCAAAVCSLDVHLDALAVGCEDGSVRFIELETQQESNHVRVSGSPINGVHMAGGSSLVAVCASGVVKILDVRGGSAGASQTFALSPAERGRRVAHCSATHPDQKNFLVTGMDDGALLMWDLRRPSAPIHVHHRHSANVWDVQFHPTSPNNVVTCSEDGLVYLWDFDASHDLMRGSFDPSGGDLKLHKLCESVTGVESVDVAPDLNMLVASASSESLLFRSRLII